MSEWRLIILLVALSILACILIIYPLRRYAKACFLLMPALLGLAYAGYVYWGGFIHWQNYVRLEQTHQQAQVMLQSIKSPQELIDKLLAKLDDSPKSAKGWYLLGRLYASQQQLQNAADAFATAYGHEPMNEVYAANYAYSLWQLSNHQFTPQITGIYRQLLQHNASQPDALAMLAMEAFARQAYENAIDYWQTLLKLAPQDSEEAQSVRKAIATAERRIKQAARNVTSQ